MSIHVGSDPVRVISTRLLIAFLLWTNYLKTWLHCNVVVRHKFLLLTLNQKKKRSKKLSTVKLRHVKLKYAFLATFNSFDCKLSLSKRKRQRRQKHGQKIHANFFVIQHPQSTTPCSSQGPFCSIFLKQVSCYFLLSNRKESQATNPKPKQWMNEQNLV